MNFEVENHDNKILSQEAAINKAVITHLGGMEKAINERSSRDTYMYLYNLSQHLKKYQEIYGFTEEESGIDLKEKAIEAATFLLESARRLKGRSGVTAEITWLEACLKAGEITYQDIGTTAEEIAKLADSAEKH